MHLAFKAKMVEIYKKTILILWSKNVWKRDD